jgi:hypothetical protein
MVRNTNKRNTLFSFSLLAQHHQHLAKLSHFLFFGCNNFSKIGISKNPRFAGPSVFYPASDDILQLFILDL